MHSITGDQNQDLSGDITDPGIIPETGVGKIKIGEYLTDNKLFVPNSYFYSFLFIILNHINSSNLYYIVYLFDFMFVCFVNLMYFLFF